MTRSKKPIYCEIHHCVLEEKRVKVIYGLILDSEKFSPDYLHAQDTQFPHTDDVVLGSCRVRSQKYRPQMVCPDCIEARNQWLTEHCPTWAEFQDLDRL
ncbi:MAG: hypothetical protein ACE5HC_06895 [Candidatus Binatia bacterium]